MSHPNLELIDRFFSAYGSRDMDAIREVAGADMWWQFPGQNPFSGKKVGIDAVIALFDQMSVLKMQAERRVSGVNDDYMIEAQRTWSTEEGVDVEMEWCVLWGFADGRIVSGTHFSADQRKADEFFADRLAAHDER